MFLLHEFFGLDISDDFLKLDPKDLNLANFRDQGGNLLVPAFNELFNAQRIPGQSQMAWKRNKIKSRNPPKNANGHAKSVLKYNQYKNDPTQLEKLFDLEIAAFFTSPREKKIFLEQLSRPPFFTRLEIPALFSAGNKGVGFSNSVKNHVLESCSNIFSLYMMRGKRRQFQN